MTWPEALALGAGAIVLLVVPAVRPFPTYWDQPTARKDREQEDDGQ